MDIWHAVREVHRRSKESRSHTSFAPWREKQSTTTDRAEYRVLTSFYEDADDIWWNITPCLEANAVLGCFFTKSNRSIRLLRSCSFYHKWRSTTVQEMEFFLNELATLLQNSNALSNLKHDLDTLENSRAKISNTTCVRNTVFEN